MLRPARKTPRVARERTPAVVAELGRPETPEETAARKAQNARDYRARKTVNNLIYSLLAVLGVVAVIYFAVPRNDVPQDWQVDYLAVASDVSTSVPGTLITPDLPSDWQANRAELTRVDGHAAWVVNFITPSQAFITYRQIFDDDASGIARLYEANRTLTNTVTVTGQAWSEYDNRDGTYASASSPHDYALATTAGGDVFTLEGTGTPAEFTTVAQSISPQLATLGAGGSTP